MTAYFDSDFCWEEHAQAVQKQERLLVSTAAVDAAPPDWNESAAQAAAWDAFHETHAAGGAFFKPRRYLAAAFPQLLEALTVLELGCGTGSSALPLLGAGTTRVACCDFSSAAVESCRASAAAAAGGESARFCAFVADPAQPDVECFNAALASATQAAGWTPPVAFSCVLAVFLLSALPPGPALGRVVATATAQLAPGGWLLVRDYGLYDMVELRFRGNSGAARPGGAFQRADGTLARFFTPDALAEEVCAAAAAAGRPLVCSSAHFCTVRVVNRGKGTEMKRVFVNASFQRAAA